MGTHTSGPTKCGPSRSFASCEFGIRVDCHVTIEVLEIEIPHKPRLVFEITNHPFELLHAQPSWVGEVAAELFGRVANVRPVGRQLVTSGGYGTVHGCSLRIKQGVRLGFELDPLRGSDANALLEFLLCEDLGDIGNKLSGGSLPCRTIKKRRVRDIHAPG